MSGRLVGPAWGFSDGPCCPPPNLVFAGIERAGYYPVAGGLAIGALFFWLIERRLGDSH